MMKLSKMKIILVSLMVLVLAAVPLLAACAKEAPAPTPTPEPEVVHWTLQNICEAGTTDYELTGPNFVDLVKKLSNDRFIIEPFPGGAIVPNTELFTATSEGVVDIAVNCPMYYVGIMPVASLEYGIPLTTRSGTDFTTYLKYFGFQDILQNAYAEQNLREIAIGVDPGVSMISTKPIRTVEDLNGLKVRAGGATASVLGGAGAAVTYISGGELYTSLATGVVEAAVYGGTATASYLSLQEVAKYWTMPYLQGGSGTVSIQANLDSWNALPDDLKAILKVAAEYIVTDAIDFKEYENARILDTWVSENGVEAVEFPASERAKLAPFVTLVLDDLATKDPKYCAPAAEALTKFMKFEGYW